MDKGTKNAEEHKVISEDLLFRLNELIQAWKKHAEWHRENVDHISAAERLDCAYDLEKILNGDNSVLDKITRGRFDL